MTLLVQIPEAFGLLQVGRDYFHSLIIFNTLPLHVPEFLNPFLSKNGTLYRRSKLNLNGYSFEEYLESDSLVMNPLHLQLVHRRRSY